MGVMFHISRAPQYSEGKRIKGKAQKMTVPQVTTVCRKEVG